MNAARINLLPHRAERRARAKKHFALVSGLAAALGLVIVLAVHITYADLISNQDGRNQFLKSEIGKLDKEIAEIDKLKDEIAALLARKQIIETLQADRAQTVHLLDELVKQMPEGVFLRSISQKGMRVQLLGYAQSNARVSTLMRNIEASRWLGDPELIEVKAAALDKRRVSEFTLFVSLKRTPVESAPAPSAAAKKG
ncbi:MAG TPA: PilN domain-containing protein [Burkholderiales bacterium]|jgi:type IV pilus assembly protein PilN|nr:PilN domain-containing protein [Burkholderiales bacterium]